MTRERTVLYGSEDGLSEMAAALADVSARRRAAAVVVGTPGVGKTALLEVAAHQWRAVGATAAEISFREPGAAWDLFGAGATLTDRREHVDLAAASARVRSAAISA